SHKRLVPFLAASACAFGIGFVSTLMSAPAGERFDHKVRNDFFAGFSGNQEALERAMKSTEDTLRKEPDHAEALVWHGSGLYYQSGMAFRSGDQAKGMEIFKRGLAEMDRAVELEPKNVGVRIPRGASLLSGSRFMPPDIARPLLEKAVNDYETVYELQKNHLNQLGVHPRGELLFGLAEGLGRLGEQEKATRFFEQILRDMKGTPYADRAALWMENKSLPIEKTGCIGCHVE
ncbi:MAG: hypothetical protein ACRD7E_31725, partial [Bryobacteraceae bacterium]